MNSSGYLGAWAVCIMSHGGTMDFVPDLKVWETANEYQEAATICEKNLKMWAAAINAALAIEIYLKSFLSKKILVSILGGIMNQGFSEAEKGHNLIDLYNKIDPSIQKIIKKESKKLDSKMDFLKRLNKYKDVFKQARYRYEQNSKKMIDNGIVRLAEHCKKLVFEVAKQTHPK